MIKMKYILFFIETPILYLLSCTHRALEVEHRVLEVKQPCNEL